MNRPVAGGKAPGVDLRTALGASGSLVVDSANAYFANRAAKTISRIPKAGGSPTVVVDLPKSTKYEPGDFDVDASHVFFAAMASNGAPLADLIQRAPK